MLSEYDRSLSAGRDISMVILNEESGSETIAL